MALVVRNGCADCISVQEPRRLRTNRVIASDSLCEITVCWCFFIFTFLPPPNGTGILLRYKNLLSRVQGRRRIVDSCLCSSLQFLCPLTCLSPYYCPSNCCGYRSLLPLRLSGGRLLDNCSIQSFRSVLPILSNSTPPPPSPVPGRKRRDKRA